jgi:hypothetical protein
MSENSIRIKKPSKEIMKGVISALYIQLETDIHL